MVVENVAESGRGRPASEDEEHAECKRKVVGHREVFDGAFDRPPWEIHVSRNEQIIYFIAFLYGIWNLGTYTETVLREYMIYFC